MTHGVRRHAPRVAIGDGVLLNKLVFVRMRCALDLKRRVELEGLHQLPDSIVVGVENVNRNYSEY